MTWWPNFPSARVYNGTANKKEVVFAVVFAVCSLFFFLFSFFLFIFYFYNTPFVQPLIDLPSDTVRTAPLTMSNSYIVRPYPFQHRTANQGALFHKHSIWSTVGSTATLSRAVDRSYFLHDASVRLSPSSGNLTTTQHLSRLIVRRKVLSKRTEVPQPSKAPRIHANKTP